MAKPIKAPSRGMPMPMPMGKRPAPPPFPIQHPAQMGGTPPAKGKPPGFADGSYDVTLNAGGSGMDRVGSPGATQEFINPAMSHADMLAAGQRMGAAEADRFFKNSKQSAQATYGNGPHFAGGTNDVNTNAQGMQTRPGMGGSWNPQEAPPPTPMSPSPLGGQNQNLRQSLGMGVKRFAEGTSDVGGPNVGAGGGQPAQGYDAQTASYSGLDQHFVAHLRAAIGLAPKEQGFAGGTNDVGFDLGGAPGITNPTTVTPADRVISGQLGPVRWGSEALPTPPAQGFDGPVQPTALDQFTSGHVGPASWGQQAVDNRNSPPPAGGGTGAWTPDPTTLGGASGGWSSPVPAQPSLPGPVPAQPGGAVGSMFRPMPPAGQPFPPQAPAPAGSVNDVPTLGQLAVAPVRAMAGLPAIDPAQTPHFGSLIQALVGQPQTTTATGKPITDPNLNHTVTQLSGADPSHVDALLNPHEYTREQFQAAVADMPWGMAKSLWAMQHYLSPTQRAQGQYLGQLDQGVLNAQNADKGSTQASLDAYKKKLQDAIDARTGARKKVTEPQSYYGADQSITNDSQGG